MKNIFLIGFIKEDLSIVGQALCEKLDFFYLNAEEMIEYSLVRKNHEIKEICGIDYLNQEEKKVIYSLNGFERTVVSMGYETFINNFEAISSSNVIIYLRQTKGKFLKRVENLIKSGIENDNLNNYLINEIVYDQRDKLLKKNCSLTIKYDISKLNEIISEIEKQLENVWN